MKDILKIMRFDFLTAKPVAWKEASAVLLLCGGMCLLLMPVSAAFMIFTAMIFLIPLQSTEDRCSFNRLYGVLPVKRKSITRARFLYAFLLHFSAEIIGLLFEIISLQLQLIRFFPDTGTEFYQLMTAQFTSGNFLNFGYIVGMFAVICVLFVYMEMMGQIFGREKEMNVILVTLAVVTVLILGYIQLSNRQILPRISFSGLPETFSGKVALSVCVNIIVFAVCIVFGEITTAAVSKREL